MKKIIFFVLLLLLLGILKIVVYDILIASYFIKNNVEEFVELYTPKEGDFLYKDLPENIQKCLMKKNIEISFADLIRVIRWDYTSGLMVDGFSSPDILISYMYGQYSNVKRSHLHTLLYYYYVLEYPKIYSGIYLNDISKKRFAVKKKYEIFPELPVIYGVQVPKDYEGPQDYDTNPSYVQHLSEWRIYWDAVAKEYGYKDFTEEDFLEIFPYCKKNNYENNQ